MSAYTAEALEGANWCGITELGGLVGAETILLVEDEVFVREVTCEVLRSAGYEVVTAQNAGEALLAYDRRCGAVDLLLTDVVLPGENGRVLAEKLKRENPGLKTLLVTGYADQMGMDAGEHVECLAKPFSTGVLLGKVRQLLDRAEFQTGKQDLVRHACGNG